MVSTLNTDSTGKWEPTAKQEGCGGGKGGRWMETSEVMVLGG